MALPDIDTADPRLSLLFVARVEYADADGVLQVARWCGPAPEQTGGTSIRGLEDLSGTYRYAPRLAEITDDLDLGGLTQGVQVRNDMRLDVTCGHRDDEDGLLRDAQLGEWGSRPAVVWACQLKASGGSLHVVGARELFRGHVAPEGVERTDIGGGAGLRVTLVDDLLPDTVTVPTTYMPTAEEISNGATPYVETASGSSGDAAWHPGDASGLSAAYLTGPTEGRHVGVVYGAMDSVATRYTSGTPVVLRELAYYGQNSGGVGATHHYFHVSPQPGCFVLNDSVKAVWFESPNAGGVVNVEALYGANLANVNIRTFENTDPAAGPVGTNVRLLLNDSDCPDGSGGGFDGPDGARCWAIVMGPGMGILDTAAPDTSSGLALGGAVRALTQGPVSGRINRDDLVIRDLVELAGHLGDLHLGALADYDTEAPRGPAGTGLYRELGCAVPAEITDDPPALREVLGSLALVGLGDFVVKLDATGRRKLAPVRRRPNSRRPGADHVFRLADLLDGRDAASIDVRVERDAEHERCTTLEVRAVDRYVPGETLGGGASAESIATAIDGPVRRRRDAAQEAARGAALASKLELKHWHAQKPPDHTGSDDEDPAFTDLSVLLAGQVTQPQLWVTAELGPRGLWVDLGDAIQYEGIPGLHVGYVGHARRIRRRFLRRSATITSIHLPDGFDRPQGDEDEE